MAQIPVIPLNAELVYMAEGAANIVYRIHFPHSTPEPTDLNEYGSGTPPPTDIEPENNLSAFDGESCHVTHPKFSVSSVLQDPLC